MFTMDNLVTLLDRKEYQLVLDLSEGSKDSSSLFCRISAYLGLGKPKEAREIVEKNKEILWQDSPLKCLKANFELRFLLEEFDEAYEDEKYFSSLPYVSQEVEEYLRSLPQRIRYNERQSSLKKNYSEEDVRETLLHPKDTYEAMSLLSSFNDAKTIFYADSLLEMLKTSTSNIVKTYGFMLLVKANYPLEVSFEKNGESFHMIPCKTLLPFEEEKAKTLVSMLQKEMKDPSLFHIATTLLNNYMFELYPLSIFDKYSLENLFACFVILSHEYLQSAFDEETFLKDNFLQKEEVELIKKDISSVLKKAEQMKV